LEREFMLLSPPKPVMQLGNVKLRAISSDLPNYINAMAAGYASIDPLEVRSESEEQFGKSSKRESARWHRADPG
jgi:hypothetical protein